MRWIAVTALALVTCLPMAAAAAEQDGVGKLTLTGEGIVAMAPDMATVTLGAVAENPEAAIAMAELRERMSEIMAQVEAAGIEERDVQTSGLSLSPRWKGDYRKSEAPGIETFVAASQIVLRIRDLDALGPLIDKLIADGANEFRGLQFGLQAPQPAQDDARRAAVAEARRKAELYAEAAGVTLGPILSIDEHGGVQPRMMRAEMASMAGDSMPIAAGELEVRASVGVTWALTSEQ